MKHAQAVREYNSATVRRPFLLPLPFLLFLPVCVAIIQGTQPLKRVAK